MILNKFKKDIDAALKMVLKDMDVNFELRSASKELYKNLQDFINRDGKRIRPILFLISYYGYAKKKKISYKKLIKGSLSFELLHDFLLIHDDVIDNSDLRRGKPSLHMTFNSDYGVTKKNELGKSLSIIAGDILFAWAIKSLLELDTNLKCKEQVIKLFTNMTTCTGIGEYIDVVNNTHKIENISQKDIYLTYTMKTAKYTFEGPLLAGGILGTANNSEQNKLSEIGNILGQVFQIQDDLLDIFLSSKETGKPVLSDLAESKKTLLAWTASRFLSGNDKIIFKSIFEKTKKTKKELLLLKKLMINSGASLYCLKKTHLLLAKSNNILSNLKMKPKYKTVLKNLIDKLITKNEKLKEVMIRV
ncbi:MAG: polyprenyl synthetase family protein [Candidatus Omnitrophica bacterium]|nr:polyprenyl synthetase family protein [Candidatus Omnitrophota bacterium]